MRRLIVTAIFWIGASLAPAQAQDFADSDWSHSFFKNCAAPNATALVWAEHRGDRVLRATLEPGDPGQCRSDSTPRHGARYWERAELRQRGDLPLGTRHDIRFQARFVEGFSGREETFFQIHGFSQTCGTGPLLMLQFDGRLLKAQVLKRESDPSKGSANRGERGALVWVRADKNAAPDVSLDALRDRTLQFRMALDLTDRSPKVSLYLNGRPLLEDEPIHVSRCATPHVKVGIYRPGQRNPHTSVVEIDDLRIHSGS